MPSEAPSPEGLEGLLRSPDPEERRRALEHCLFSENSGLRALAAQIVSREEAPEALLHIDQMLLGNNLPDKHFALQICILLPFERVKDLLIRFFEREDDPGLLQSAGVIFTVNPHSEIPSRLYEIGKSAPPLKRQMVQLVIREIFGTLHKASLHKNLIHSLGAPDPGLRLFTIRQIAELPTNQVLQSALEEQLKVETDIECQVCLKSTLSMIRKSNVTPSHTGKDLPVRAEARALLKEPKPPHPSKPPPFGSTQDLTDLASPEDYREKLRHLQVNDLAPFVSKALAGPTSIRLAIIETFIARAPHILFPHLRPLLEDPEPMIRCLGVRALTVIDPEESVEYLESLVLGKLSPSKEVALQECLFLPFKLVKSLLLKFCATENLAEHLETAEVIFLSNPDWDVPFRLYELLPGSSPEKRTILERAIRGVAECLLKNPSFAEQSHLSTPVEDLKSFLQRLDSWQAKKLLEEKTGRDLLLQAIVKEFGKEEVETLLGASHRCTTPGHPAKFPMSEAEFLALQEEERIGCLAEWPESSGKSLEPFLKTLLTSTQESPRVRAAALRTAARMQIQFFAETARALVSKGDYRLRIAAFEYLIAANPSLGEKLIGEFVGSPNVFLRAKGIEYLQADDLALSIARLGTLFCSKDGRAHRAGFLTLLRLPFSSIRHVLTMFLASPPGASYLRPGILVFEANPDPENLYSLFVIEKSHATRVSAEVIRLIRESRCKLTHLLEHAGRLNNTEDYTDKTFEAKWRASEIARQGPPKAYAFSNRNESKETASIDQFLQNIAILLRKHLTEAPQKCAFFFFGCLMIVTILLVWLLGQQPSVSSTSGPSVQANVKVSSNQVPISQDIAKALHEYSKQAFLDKSLRRGRLALAKGDPKQAKIEYEEALKKTPNNPYIRTFARGGLCEVARSQKDSKALEIQIMEYATALDSLPGKSSEPFIHHLEELRKLLGELKRTK